MMEFGIDVPTHRGGDGWGGEGVRGGGPSLSDKAADETAHQLALAQGLYRE